MGRTLTDNEFSEFSSVTTGTSSDESVISNKDKKHKCTQSGCFASFPKRRKLINHMRLHTGERPFVCSEPGCDKKYTNSSHLRRHKKVSHEKAAERIECPFDGCERELANKWALKKHAARWHDPARVYPFKCEQCSQGFSKKRQLQQHAYVHTGKLPFECRACDKRFATSREHNKHKRVHFNLYECDCKEVFDKWSSYLAHRKKCPEREMKCPSCKKEFSNLSNLKCHQKTHISPEDREIFECPYENCNRQYFYQKNLMSHIKRFHENEPSTKIPCSFEGCTKTLSKMQNYKEHIKKHHANTDETNQAEKQRKTRKDKGTFKKSIRGKLINFNNTDNTNVQNTDANTSIISNVPSGSITPQIQ